MGESFRRTGTEPKRLTWNVDRSCWHAPRTCVGSMGTREVGNCGRIEEGGRALDFLFRSGTYKDGRGIGRATGPAGTRGDEVTNATDWPPLDFSAKSLTKYLGSYWRDTHPSWASAIECFHRWAELRNFAIRRRVLDYNEDEFCATRVLRVTIVNLPIRPRGTA